MKKELNLQVIRESIRSVIAATRLIQTQSITAQLALIENQK
jgi:hypothetical protein